MMSHAIHSMTPRSITPRTTPISFFFMRVTSTRSLSKCTSGQPVGNEFKSIQPCLRGRWACEFSRYERQPRLRETTAPTPLDF
jgi:hypothetical protein